MPNGFSFKDMDALMESQRQVESGGRRYAVSGKGAIGRGQIMPNTAKMYGFSPEDMFDPAKNEEVQRRYMTDLLTRYSGDVRRALDAYSGGAAGYADKVLGGMGRGGPASALTMFSPSGAGGGGAGQQQSNRWSTDYSDDPLSYLPPEEPSEPLPRDIPRTPPRPATPRVMPPDPRHYDNGADFVKAFEDNYPGFGNLDHAHQENLAGAAMRDWKEKHVSVEIDKKFQEMNRAAEFKGAAWAGGADFPTDPNAGMIERGRNWFIQNVNKPALRVAQMGVAGLFQGPQAMQENWENPGDHPNMRLAAHAVPILGTDTPEGMALDAILLASDPFLKAARIGMMAREGSKIVGPAARLAGRVAVPAAAGAAIGIPQDIQQGSLMPSAKLAATGAGAQLTAESTSAIFGFGRRGLQRLFETDMAQNIAGRSEKVFGRTLQTGKDFVNLFWRTTTGKGGWAISEAEKATEKIVTSTTNELNRGMAGHEFEHTFENPRMASQAGPIEGQHLGGPAAATKVLTPSGQPVGLVRTKPEGTYRFEWEQAMNTYMNFRERGWGAYGDLVRGRAGMIARSMAREMRNVMAKEASQWDQKLATRWLRGQVADDWARLLTNLFSTKGAIEGNKLSAPAIQAIVTSGGKTGLMRDIIETIGEKDGKAFLSAVQHGGGIGSSKDVAGAIGTVTARFHPSAGLVTGHAPALPLPFGIVGASVGLHGTTLPYRGGFQPFDLGRGAWSIVSRLGAAGTFRLIQEELGDGYVPEDRPMVPNPADIEAHR